MIVVAVIAAAIVVAAIVLNRRSAADFQDSEAPSSDRMGPKVSDFHMREGVASVFFDVPLADGDIDDILQDLLIREAVEVVRDKRHSLPLGEVHRVVALGKRDGGWLEVGSITLDTPGELPPPLVPELLPHASREGFDLFENMAGLPAQAPGLAAEKKTEGLEPIGPTLTLPRKVEAGIRAPGLDPASTEACDLALGVMRLAGYRLNERSMDTLDATLSGQRVFVRTVPHEAGDHPELPSSDVGRFVADFVTSGADRGLLLTEKYSPFEIYERERREPRMRFITRERFQDFVDALSMG